MERWTKIALAVATLGLGYWWWRRRKEEEKLAGKVEVTVPPGQLAAVIKEIKATVPTAKVEPTSPQTVEVSVPAPIKTEEVAAALQEKLPEAKVEVPTPPRAAYYLVPCRPTVAENPEGSWAYISVTAPILELTGAPMSTVGKPAPAAEIRQRLIPYYEERVPPRYEVALSRIAGLEHLLQYPDTPIKCPVCGAEFWKREELERHKAEIHPPPPPPPLEERVAQIIAGEFAVFKAYPDLAKPPTWAWGTDYWQGWLQRRIETYRMNAAKAEIDPELAEVYLAVAAELERIKVESLRLSKEAG